MQAGHGQFDHRRHGTWGRPIAAAHANWLLRLWLTMMAIALPACFISCARLQLPAIDPNGQCIFLPFPNTTQLALRDLHHHGGDSHFAPTPAFPTPTMPPPCLDGDGKPPQKHSLLKQHKLAAKIDSHFASPGKSGEIQLTPLRVVAPVGGEVVLLAGICGKNGYLAKREPLEWMLSPDSVGTFIEVGDDANGHLINSLSLAGSPRVEKLDVDFARGRTSNRETLITRGTPDCKDDIELKEGQTWLSLSSPSEGVSRITVLAPDSQLWDRRRQTATIYWVDAQWEFPQPQIARSGQTLEFISRVTKAENLVPAEGWIVRYTIIDPSVAAFVPRPDVAIAGNTATVRVNKDAQAPIGITSAVDAQGQSARGTTPIAIDVVRPAQPSDNLPELKLGGGQTFATFSSPGLNLQVFGADVGSVGEQLTYVASLGNPGDVPAENVQLVMNYPVGTRVVSATPQPSSTANTGLVWDQGVLDAHRQLDVTVVLEALRPGVFDVVFQAAAAGNLSARSDVRTEIIEASVDLRFDPVGGAAQTEVGQLIEYDIDIKNTSRQTLTNLKVLIESDPGLPEQETGNNKVEQTISFIQPGQSFPLRIGFIARQLGQLAAKVRVYAGENLLAERTASVLGVQARVKQPAVGVSVNLPETMRVGERINATITLSNPGEVKLTGLNVELVWDPALRAVQIDLANSTRYRLGADNRSLTWSPQDLLPRLTGDSGDMIRNLLLQFECIAPTASGSLAARVTAAEGVQAVDSKTFQAIDRAVVPPVNPPVNPPSGVFPPNANRDPGSSPTPGPQQRTGGWKISLEDWNDPTTVGNDIRYSLVVLNDQNLVDSNVRVQLQLPQGAQLKSVTGLDGTSIRYTFGENSVNFEPLNSVRSGETISYIIVLNYQVPGEKVVRARVLSTGQPNPQQTEQTTTVNAGN